MVGPVLGLAVKLPSAVGLLNEESAEASRSKPTTLELKLELFHRAKESMVNVPPRPKSKLPVVVPEAEIQSLLMVL